MAVRKRTKPVKEPREERLDLRYVPLEEAHFFDLNPKLHDLQLIAESIKQNGFRDPPIWDATLNGGKGGIVAGNGRTEALFWMKSHGVDVPRGIAVDDSGQWCMPVIFGCDAESELQAQRFAIDHNSLVVAGGDGFTAVDMMRIYDRKAYMKLLGILNDEDYLPITLDQEDFALLTSIDLNDDGFGGTGAGGTGAEGDGHGDGHGDGGEEDTEKDLSDGSLLSVADVVIKEPSHPVFDGDIWQVGKHVLCCASVINGHELWLKLLKPGWLFAPYCGAFIPLSKKAESFNILMVQPDPYLAGILLDQYINVYGKESVALLERKK